MRATTDTLSGDVRAPLRTRTERREGGASLHPATNSPARTSPRRVSNYLKRPLQSLGAFAFSAIVAVVVVTGWQSRHERYLSPEEGLGYQLGIVGAVTMLILLLYPLRKRLKAWRGLGSVGHWFRLHMLLGIVGPVLILFHANFQVGSMNSNIALVSMLLVAASGMVGRFIYARIHMGLYGRKARMGEMLADANAFRQALGADVNDLAGIAQELKAFEQSVHIRNRGLLANAWSSLSLTFRIPSSRASILRRSRRIVREQAKVRGWTREERKARLRAAEYHLSEYLAAVRKAAQFAFYDKLFSYWHVLHLPLFFFLILAAILHVIATHLY